MLKLSKKSPFNCIVAGFILAHWLVKCYSCLSNFLCHLPSDSDGSVVDPLTSGLRCTPSSTSLWWGNFLLRLILSQSSLFHCHFQAGSSALSRAVPCWCQWGRTQSLPLPSLVWSASSYRTGFLRRESNQCWRDRSNAMSVARQWCGCLAHDRLQPIVLSLFKMALREEAYRKVWCRRRSLGLRTDIRSNQLTGRWLMIPEVVASELRLQFSSVLDVSHAAQHAKCKSKTDPRPWTSASTRRSRLWSPPQYSQAAASPCIWAQDRVDAPFLP